MLGKNSALAPGSEFELALSSVAMADIIENKMRVMDFAPWAAYEGLSANNQRALKHLVRAADALDNVFLKQDHPDNIRAREVLRTEATKGISEASQALTLFTIFNGLEGKDLYAHESQPLRLFKNKQLQPGKAFYPQDITRDELVDYVVKHPEQASALFSNNTIVSRENGRLVAKPYSAAFREEMEAAARELLAAANATDHKGLTKYLRWQAQALVNDTDPQAMFMADRHWIALEDSPLEFTIGREDYDDRLSGSVTSDPRVQALLESNAIIVKSKDSISGRVGIVNGDSYHIIAECRQQLEAFNQQAMPLLEQYQHQADGLSKRKMTFADVDVVAFTASNAAVRGGVPTAQNLPNKDKLSVQLGEGGRLVFHRTARQSIDLLQKQQFLNALIDPVQHLLYKEDASFLFVVNHELAHSLGPSSTKDGRDVKGALGKWGNMIEESKADLTSIIIVAYLAAHKRFTAEQEKEIYLTLFADKLPSRRPSEEEAHLSRSIMEINYFREHGAIIFEKGGKLSVAPEKMADTARKMLIEVLTLQLEGNADKTQAFVSRYRGWNDALQYSADEQMKLNPRLYTFIRQPLKEKLLALD